MPRLNFGAFLAPHHPIGEHPMLQFRRDLDLVEHLDKLGYDEFWCGEHHSSGWEMIGSPEMFLAAAGERSKRIKLATGVVSLPYHHPFNVAQRMVQLDHMTGGRAIFGSGPGALASDAHTLGIDPMVLRDRQDEAIGVIRRLFTGERVTVTSDWFTLQDAALQLLPLQDDMPCAVASQISPSGMTLAGKHGIGIISIGSLSEEGLNALPTQWGFAEAAAAKHGQIVDRRNWRVLLSWHIAETREQARAEARDGLMRHHNEYITATLQRPGARPYKTPDEAVDKTAFVSGAAATIGTPDDLVERIKSVIDISGGFGTVVGFVHDWANPENTMRSWDMVARYVVPELNGYLAGLRRSREFVVNNRESFNRAREAVMAKITENEAAAAALAVTKSPMLSASSSNVPDLDLIESPEGIVTEVTRRVVFLDIDGVLAPIRRWDRYGDLDPACIQVLNEIVARGVADVVVSSTWRHGKTVAELQEVLEAEGFTGSVVDKTPTGGPGADRGEEILAWLTEHAVGGYVIIDDHRDMGALCTHLIQTHSARGLQPADAPRAIAMLMRPTT